MKPRILVPFDFNEGAQKALAWAAELHAATGGDPLHIVHAISLLAWGTPGAPAEMVFPEQDEIAVLKQDLIREAAKYDAHATVEVAIRATPLGDAVLAVAKEKQADLIVMGTHGRTGVKRLVMGSVAEHVLRYALCPVVTVRGHRVA